METYGDTAERAEIYRLFSSLFMGAPTGETVAGVRAMFRTKFSDSLEQIRKDFVDMFLRPDHHLPPYESLYNFEVGEKPGLWGKAAREVQTYYEAAGLILDEEIQPVPDHLAVELLFMSYLVENGHIEKQITFVEKHLVNWVPEYCDQVYKHATTTFYREVAELLKEFVLSEYEIMSK